MELRAVFKPTDDEHYKDLLVKMGISGIEVLYQEPYLDAAEFLKFQARIEAMSQQHGFKLSVHAPHIDVNLASLNRQMRAVSINSLLRSAEWARSLGADVLVIHPGLGVYGMSQGSWHHGFTSPSGWQECQLELVAEAIDSCARLFPNLILAVENMIFPHEFFRTPEDLALLMEKISAPNVGVCLDVGHANAACQSWIDFFSVLGERIVHLHIHDNHGAVDEHLPVGQGSIGYFGFYGKAAQFRYRGAITAEFHIKEDPTKLLLGIEG